MTGLKSNKIVIEKIIEIASKTDYGLLERSIEKTITNKNQPNTLF